MQTIVCAIALMFMNGAYLVLSFNMDSLTFDESDPEIEEVITRSTTTTDFELADLLDLDILDFDVEELAKSQKQNRSISRSSDMAEDRVI